MSDPQTEPSSGPSAAGELPLTVVIPVYQEQDTIARTLAEVREKVSLPHRLLIVHDTPDDPTVPVVEAIRGNYPRLELVLNQIGPGVLNAIRQGFEIACRDAEAQGQDGAVVVVMADLSDDLAQIGAMHALLCDGCDLVAGSRYMRGGAQYGGGVIKSNLSWLAGRSLRALTKIPTHDVTNAFRMYRTSFLRAVEVESTGGFELSMELTVKAWARGFRVAEVPSVWRDRSAGESKFKLVEWLPSYLRWYVDALKHEYLGREV